nr:MAG: hypothetical protein [Lake Baikal virophage 8]
MDDIPELEDYQLTFLTDIQLTQRRQKIIEAIDNMERVRELTKDEGARLYQTNTGNPLTFQEAEEEEFKFFPEYVEDLDDLLDEYGGMLNDVENEIEIRVNHPNYMTPFLPVGMEENGNVGASDLYGEEDGQEGSGRVLPVNGKFLPFF